MFRPGTRWRILHLSVRSLRTFQLGMRSQSPHPHHHLHKKKAVRPDVWLRIERRKRLDQLGSCGIINSRKIRMEGAKEHSSCLLVGEVNVCLFFVFLPSERWCYGYLIIVRLKSCIVRTTLRPPNLAPIHGRKKNPSYPYLCWGTDKGHSPSYVFAIDHSKCVCTIKKETGTVIKRLDII